MAGERIQFTGVRPYPGFDQEEMKRRWNENDNGFDYNDDYRPSARSTSYPQTSRRPLINYVKNEWRTNPKYGQVYSYSPPPDRDCPDTLHMLLSIITAPKFRRYVLVYILLLSIGFGSWKAVSPRLKEHEILTESLNENMKLAKGGWFGTNVRAVFTDMIHMKTLDKDYLPGDKKPKHGKETRLIVVGDVHGCKEELVALLDKVSFDRETDHLILAGDMISKGPESQNVVDLARKLGASCVRGSHEDRILLVRPDAMRVSSNAEGDSDDLEEENFSHGDYADRALARKLTDKQYDWLKSCPVILRVGEVKGMGKLVVVHAGLVPGVELEKQDPAGVMNMRTIDLNTHVPSKEHEGVPWTKLWNHHQTHLHLTSPPPAPRIPEHRTPSSEQQKQPPQHTTVLYGHDSRRGLQISKYTKGLDTGCFKGGKLTALVISSGGRTKVVQVGCRDYRTRKPFKVEIEDTLRDGAVGRKQEHESDELD